MKKIGEIITISKVWDKCRQWTTNRVFDHQNPNRSMENLNYAYAMTDDVRVQFFNDYFVRVICELETDDLLISLRKYNRISFSGENVSLSFEDDTATLYFVVGNYFPSVSFNNLLHSYCQWKVLYYWYWEKDLTEQCDKILMYLEQTRSKIQTIASGEYESTDGETMKGRIPYNDGFVLNPPRKSVTDDIPSSSDEPEIIDPDDKTPTPTPTPTPTTPTWYISQDFADNIKAQVGSKLDFTISINKIGEESRDIKEVKFEFYSAIDNEITSEIRTFLKDKILLPLETQFEVTITDAMVGKFVYAGCEIYITFEQQPNEVYLSSKKCIIEATAQSNGVYSEQYNETYE